MQDRIEQLLSIIVLDDEPLRVIVRNTPDYQNIVDDLAYIIAVKNAVGKQHPVDDLADVFANPDRYATIYSSGDIDDNRLLLFITTPIVALLAIMSEYNLSYDEIVDHVLTEQMLDYLAIHGNELAAFGYDDSYDILSHYVNQ